MPTAVLVQQDLHYRSRLDDVTWERLVGRIVEDHPEISRDVAEQVMDATIGFLVLCGQFPGRKLAPSAMVDIGWHTFLLYTREYQRFCTEQVGSFVHHSPTDLPGEETDGEGVDTTAFMIEHGVVFNEAMWWSIEPGSRPKPKPKCHTNPPEPPKCYPKCNADPTP